MKLNRKEIASSFLKEVSAGRIREAFNKYIHSDFKHHLVFFKGDMESFKQAMEENYRQFHNKTYEIMRSLEDDKLVAVHGKVELAPKVYGVIYIFQFKGDKII